MDVKCLTCGEPWDTYHLWHEAIWGTGLPEEEVEEWSKLPRREKLNARYRHAFRQAGYEFGTCLIDVRRCPCCPEGAQPEPGKEFMRESIAEMLGSDEDGLAATLEDFGV